jgi:hypothetical protein
MIRPSTSSITAAASRTRLARSASRPRLAPQAGQPPAENEWCDHSRHRHPESGPAHPQQLRGPDLESDLEEQEEHTQLAEQTHRFVRRQPAEDVRSDQDAGHDLTDQRRHAQPLAERAEELRRHEDEHQRQQGGDVGGVRHGRSASRRRAVEAAR